MKEGNWKKIPSQIASVTSWLEDSCGKNLFGLENLFVANFPKGDTVVRGIGVTKDLPKDTFFVCVPRKCWFGPANMPYRYKSLRTKFPEVRLFFDIAQLPPRRGSYAYNIAQLYDHDVTTSVVVRTTTTRRGEEGERTT